MALLNKSDYWAKVEWLELRDPSNPHLDQFKAEHNFYNSFLLEKEISTLPPPLAETEEEKKEKRKNRPEELNKLYAQVKNLINKKKKTSNEFHNCRSDGERARISAAVRDLHKRIQKQLENIEFYRKHQELPKGLDKEKYPIPDNPIELMKLKKNLMSERSRKKKVLAQWTAKGIDKKIKYHSKKLQEINIHLKYVERTIASIPV